MKGLGIFARNLRRERSGRRKQTAVIAIAMAPAKNPKVLLVDESTGNLDEVTRDEIMELFVKLWREGLTIVMVTHDSAVAARAERRLSIKSGKIAEEA